MFLVAMLVAGTVPMSPIAKAVGPSAAASACSGITHTVLAGDGWMSIARKASFRLADLLNANAATVATVIHPDQVLCLPSGGTVPMGQIAKAVGPSATASACSGITHTVLAGDGWMAIARKASVPLADLLNANAATVATVIHPGQVLCLPSGGTVRAPTNAQVSRTPPAVASRGALDVFPVQGTCSYIDTYGAPRSGGRTHEGVDILARAGQSIYAVKNGTLTKRYLDTPLTGNGWRLTAPDGTYFLYAHLSTLALGLSVGSTVTAGQIIGQVGMTGDALSPHLHFEVHPGGGASVDPTPIVRAVDACNVTDALP